MKIHFKMYSADRDCGSSMFESVSPFLNLGCRLYLIRILINGFLYYCHYLKAKIIIFKRFVKVSFTQRTNDKPF